MLAQHTWLGVIARCALCSFEIVTGITQCATKTVRRGVDRWDFLVRGTRVKPPEGWAGMSPDSGDTIIVISLKSDTTFNEIYITWAIINLNRFAFLFKNEYLLV